MSLTLHLRRRRVLARILTAAAILTLVLSVNEGTFDLLDSLGSNYWLAVSGTVFAAGWLGRDLLDRFAVWKFRQRLNRRARLLEGLDESPRMSDKQSTEVS